MSSNSLKCPICYEPYNLSTRVPRNVSTCGHTLCVSCLSEVLRFPGNFRCPIDNQTHFFTQKTLDAFPVNFALRDLIEERGSFQVCSKHQKELEFVCMNDQMTLCSHCVLFEHSTDRRLHEIKPLKDLSGLAVQNVGVLKDLLNDLEEEKKEANERLTFRKNAFMKLFREKFDEISFLVRAKEKELEGEIGALFQREEERIDNIVGEKAGIRKKIVDRINGSQDVSTSSDPFKLLSGNHQDIRDEVNGIRLEEKLDEVEDVLKDTYLDFAGILDDAVKHLEGLESQTIEVTETIDGIYENVKEFDQDYQMLNKVMIQSQAFIIQPNQGLFNSLVEIKENMQNSTNSIPLDLRQLENISMIYLTLSKAQTPILSQEDLKSLAYLRSAIPDLKSVNIDARTEIQTPYEVLRGIFSALFYKPKDLSFVDLHLKNIKNIGDNEIKLISELVFEKAFKLRKIRLDLSGLRISSEAMQGLFQSMLPVADNLEDFELKVNKLSITDEAFCEILVKMGNISTFKLCVEDTGFGDKALFQFIANTLRWMTKVLWLELRFAGTRITGDGVKELLLKLPKRLRGFILGLGRNMQIGDECLEYFVRHKFPKMEQLGHLNISVDETVVSAQMKDEIKLIKATVDTYSQLRRSFL